MFDRVDNEWDTKVLLICGCHENIRIFIHIFYNECLKFVLFLSIVNFILFYIYQKMYVSKHVILSGDFWLHCITIFYKQENKITYKTLQNIHVSNYYVLLHKVMSFWRPFFHQRTTRSRQYITLGRMANYILSLSLFYVLLKVHDFHGMPNRFFSFYL